jgi:hypothetical protein
VKKSRLNRTTGLRRTPMPPRKTPLEGKRLSSSGLDSVDRAGVPAARSAEPMRPPVKQRRRDTGPSKEVRGLVKARARGLCEHCGAPGTDIHHRRPRAMGGTSDPAANLPSNLVLLCRSSHRILEEQRWSAHLLGWLVRQGADPAQVPVRMAGRWVLLDDAGGWSYVEVGAA